VVFVSHDRYFIDKLATRIFEVGSGEIHVFPGNYEDYIWRKEGKSLDLTLPGLAPALNPNHATPALNHQAPARRLNPIKLKKMQDRRRQLEEVIASAEAEISSYEKDLASFVSPEETARVSRLLAQSRTTLNALMTEWEEVSQAVESQQA